MNYITSSVNSRTVPGLHFFTWSIAEDEDARKWPVRGMKKPKKTARV